MAKIGIPPNISATTRPIFTTFSALAEVCIENETDISFALVQGTLL